MTITKSTQSNTIDSEKQYGTIPFSSDLKTKVVEIQGKGRGIISLNSITSGRLIMCDAVDRYSGREAKALKERDIYYHLFVDPEHYHQFREIDLLWAIGPISIVNHSNTPNCEVVWHKNKGYEWVILKSIKNIKKKEELTIFYTNIEEYAGHELYT